MSSSNTLWDFALSCYQTPGVAEHLLAWQEQYQLNINLVLWLLWLEQQDLTVDLALVQEAQTQTRIWRTQVIQPLRALRRQVKQTFSLSDESIAQVYAHLQTAELATEKVELNRLEQVLPGPKNLSVEWGENLRIYTRSLDIPERELAALQKLLAHRGKVSPL